MAASIPFAQAAATDIFRALLTDVLDDLMDPVKHGFKSKTKKVGESLRNISRMYNFELSRASPQSRPNFNDPANRCAYVFLYLMQHCNVVFFSLQRSLSDISASWRNKNKLKICSIGGGPGSDLVGLATFLKDPRNRFRSPSLECLVLDLYPINWKQTWDALYRHLPDHLDVSYRICDLVRDTSLPADVVTFIKEADMLTLVKSFSTIAAFLKADPSHDRILRAILREMKPGCFMLYIDNKFPSINFHQRFARPAGLKLVSELTVDDLSFDSVDQYSPEIREYSKDFDYNPLNTCDVTIQLFCKDEDH